MESSRRAVLAAGLALTASGCAVYGKQPANTDETVIGKASEVPVGGAKIFGDVVVSQPAAGQFQALTAICTHQGCKVSGIEGAELSCPCHGSRFNLRDGSVAQGPATQALAAVKIKLSGENLVRLPD